MPLAECKVCNRRFRGKHAERVVKTHMTKVHGRAQSENNNKEPERLWTKEDLISVLDKRLSTNVVADEKMRIATDFVWRGLSTQQRCRLLGDFFIQHATTLKYEQENKHDHTDVLDGEVVSDR